MASRGELQSWYIFYRRLSNYAAHPSLDALTYQFDEVSEYVDFGPNKDTGDLVKAADDLCLFACLFFELFAEFVEVDSDVLDSIRSESAEVQARQEASLKEPS